MIFAPALVVTLAISVAGVAPADAKDKAPELPTPALVTTACTPAPKGMACVASGAASVGSDDGAPNEKPKRSIQLSTFYVDQHEVTNADFKACVDAGVCPALKGAKLGDSDKPVIGIDYDRAWKVCAFEGKRLPTEWEWEKAAGTKDAMADAGSNPEWTSTWVGIVGHRKLSDDEIAALPDEKNGQPKPTTAAIPRSDKEPCESCEGVDPRGPCDGGDPCEAGGDRKEIRGSVATKEKVDWKASMRHSARITQSEKLTTRCASDSPTLAKFPAKVATEKRAKPPAPTAPSADQLKQFADVTEDKLDTQVCPKQGRAFLDCRDPISYIESNEPRQQLWRPYIENLGGGYTGVGIDQSYTFIATAKSEWAWLFDYDPTVVRLHWILRAVILHSANRGEFVDHFRPKAMEATLKILDDEYKDNPEHEAYREIYKVSSKALLKYYETQLKGIGGDPTFGWLATDENYDYIRTLYQQGRMRAFKGNMLDSHTMQGIGAAAKKMGVTIKIYYPSNAPECWPFTKEYKANVLALPFDPGSVVLQTVSGLQPGYGRQTGHWHYNVQNALAQQALIARPHLILAKQLIAVRNKTQDPELTISGLPAADQ
jgi:hypothetical protein